MKLVPGKLYRARKTLFSHTAATKEKIRVFPLNKNEIVMFIGHTYSFEERGYLFLRAEEKVIVLKRHIMNSLRDCFEEADVL